MESDETFEAISHPLRIKILELLAKKPMSFSELKKELGISSSGKLDFHLKKLGSLITMDEKGKYTLSKEGYAALQAITTVKRYGWQKRAFLLNTVVCMIVVAYILWTIYVKGVEPLYIAILVLVALWYLYYSYWCIVRRGVFKTY